MRILLTLLIISAAAQATAQDKYTVRFDHKLETVEVQACFEGKLPKRLYHNEKAVQFSGPVATPYGEFRLRQGSGSTPLPPIEPGSCLNWEVDLGRATDKEDFRLAMRVGDDLITDADLWFWRGSGDRKLQVEVGLPEGMNISVPWPEIGHREDLVVFEPEITPATWASRIAVGRFSLQTLQVADTQVRLAVTGSLAGAQQEKLQQWIHQAATAVGSIYGQFPQTSPQVLIVPIGARNEPVPWAHVMRGGGVSAEFFVDENRTLEEFNSDWTACHELSHMLLPFIASRDRWLSEGLASYYQYVLLARSGMLSEQQAWQGLFEGFTRGQDATHDRTLAEATQGGRDATMRVYWSGAAMMLIADTRLRTATGGRQSLDTALAGLRTCCLDTDKRWRAEELFQQLDRLTGMQIFSSVYEEHVSGRDFPDLQQTWQSLGIITRFDRIRLSDDAPLAKLRTSIMSN